MKSAPDRQAINRRLNWALFAMSLIGFGYFDQGGGWNANGRFAMVRAIVEQGKVAIDSYLIYTPAADGSTDLQRIPLRDGEYVADGRTNVLVWTDRQSRAFPINTTLEGRKQDLGDVKFVDLRAVSASGDVSYYDGHFYPNKAPGTSFTAVPAYWIVYQIERLIGANPDNWWIMTVNAWLSCALSVGLLSAFGVVLFYRLAVSFSDGRAGVSLLAAFTFAFGTMFFPYATCLYEHNIIAVCLLASFYLLYRVKSANPSNTAGGGTDPAFYFFLSGLCAGYAAITNYIIVVAVIFLGLYSVLSVRRKYGWLWFGLGLLGPFLLICIYNTLCFGTPFTTNYRHQNPYFQSGSNAFLDVFVLPRWDVLVAILFSPFRGLFFSSPVLLIASTGIVFLFRNKNFRPEAYLISAIFIFVLLFNISFNGWDGGWAVAPRYIGPAIPFLALGLVIGFSRFFKTTLVLGAISIAIMLLITTVDPQPPIGVSDTAQILDKPPWKYDPIFQYELPIFLHERAWPLIREQEQQVLRFYEAQLKKERLSETERSAEHERFREHITGLIAAGEPAPLVLNRNMASSEMSYSIQMSDVPAITGPVSVNVGGIYGGGILGPNESRWNSFNAGEFFFPESRWSLLPLLVPSGFMAWLAFRMARQLDAIAG